MSQDHLASQETVASHKNIHKEPEPNDSINVNVSVEIDRPISAISSPYFMQPAHPHSQPEK